MQTRLPIIRTFAGVPKALVDAKTSLKVIAAKLQKTSDTIIKKCDRLGLEVVVGENFAAPTTTSNLNPAINLPSVERRLGCLTRL